MRYESRFQATLIKALTEEVERLGADLASGSANDFETYKWAVGLISGLRQAIDIAERVMEEMSDGDS